MVDSRTLAALAAKLDQCAQAMIEAKVEKIIADRALQSGRASVLPRAAVLLVQAGKKRG